MIQTFWMICTFTNRFHLLGKIHLKSSCWFFIRGFIFFRRGRILLVISPDIWWYLINYLLEITSSMKFFFTKIREICALCQSFCSIWPVGWIILWKFNWNPRYQGTTITMYTLLMKATSRYTKYVLEKNIFRCNHTVKFESTNSYNKYKADFWISSFKMKHIHASHYLQPCDLKTNPSHLLLMKVQVLLSKAYAM